MSMKHDAPLTRITSVCFINCSGLPSLEGRGTQTKFVSPVVMVTRHRLVVGILRQIGQIWFLQGDDMKHAAIT